MFPSEFRRDLIRVGLLRKRECDQKAVAIVERLADRGVQREWLRDAVSCHVKDKCRQKIIANFCGLIMPWIVLCPGPVLAA